MGEFTSLLEFLTDTGAAVLPWILLALVIWIVLFIGPKLLPSVQDYYKTKAKAQTAIVEREAERNEIMRNNNAVIENNTAILELMRGYTDKQTEIIANHEQMSAERMTNLQTVLDHNHDELAKIRGELGILLDRKD